MPVVAPPRFEDVLADQITYFASQSARATDFNPGSVTRTILEIIAQVQERRDVAAWATLNNAIDEAVFDAWGFTKREAQPATGQIMLFRDIGSTVPFTIRQGALFRVPDSTTHVYAAVSPSENPDGTNGWVSLDGTTWLARDDGAVNYLTLNLSCVNPGAQGNIGPGLITQADSAIPGIVQIRNLKAFTNGLDVATDAERRADFAAYIQALPRGTPESLKFGAKTAAIFDNFGNIIERIRKVNLVEPDGGGLVEIYVNSGTSLPTSPALIDTCQEVIDGYTDLQGVRHEGWRAAGITTTVIAATLIPVSLKVNVTVATGYQLENVVALVKQALNNLFRVLDVGQPVLRNDVLMFIKLVPGVLDAEIYAYGTAAIDEGPTTLFSSLSGVQTGVYYLNQVQGSATLGTRTIAINYPEIV